MHRKIVVVDGQLGFIGGINYSADHVADFGPEAKQDYAVQVRGPVVAHLHHFTRQTVLPKAERQRARQAGVLGRPMRARRTPCSSPATTNSTPMTLSATTAWPCARAQPRGDCQCLLLSGLPFHSGNAPRAKRGVDVRLILQGQPDMPIVRTAASLLYDHLLRAGVRIYEYCDRPLCTARWRWWTRPGPPWGPATSTR